MNVANFIDALRRDDDLDNQQQSGDGARGSHATHFLFLWLSKEGTDYGRLWRRGAHLRLVNNFFVSEEGEVEWTMAMSYYCVCHRTIGSAAVDCRGTSTGSLDAENKAPTTLF